MTDDLPSGTPDNALNARPEPTDRRRFSFRIRGLMLVIVAIAAWLGLFRASPFLAILLAVLAVPTLLSHRWFVMDAEREAGGPIDLFSRIMLLALATVASLVGATAVTLFVAAFVAIIARGLGLDR